MKNVHPGPDRRLGVLVPSSNSNAESSISRMLVDHAGIGVHYSRFSLPPDLDSVIDRTVLGDAPMLLAEVEPEGVAFHGTSGSWKGLDADRRLCDELERLFSAPVTTASLAVVEALAILGLSRVGLVFPGPAEIAEQIVDEYARNDIQVRTVAGLGRNLTNAEIARLSTEEIDAFATPAFNGDVDAVVCIGTNMRSAYLVEGWERTYGVPVVDSATATLWKLLRMIGAGTTISGWGTLLSDA